MNQRERENKASAERMLFHFGKDVLGKSAGGLISKLLARGFDYALRVIETAQDKQDPREYVAAILANSRSEMDVKIGEKMGKYVWNGSRWAEVA